MYNQVKRLYDINDQLMAFVDRCRALGFSNNDSLVTMKWKWCLENGGAWYATYKNDSVISVSGIHLFEDGYRALFRGAQLEPRDVPLNRYHMQSHCFHGHLPHQIKFAGSKPIYVTTNVNNDASGKMLKIDKVFSLMSATGLVRLLDTKEIFNTMQNVWLLDKDAYLKARERF
jgi:hypothetical protein